MTYVSGLTEAQKALIHEATRTFPVRLGELANKLGVNVYKATLPAGISGEIKRISDVDYIIRINRHEAVDRQRFTLAHEIGHYLLHRHLIGDGLADDALYRSKLSTVVEHEANRFAADLLMPRTEIENILKQSWVDNDVMIGYAANRFGVSSQAAKIRLGL